METITSLASSPGGSRQTTLRGAGVAQDPQTSPSSGPHDDFVEIGDDEQRADPTRDPAVQKAIGHIEAAGGYVFQADRDRILGELNDGPRWYPVTRERDSERNVGAILNALLG